MPNNDNDNEELGIDDLQYFSIKNNQLFWHGSEIQTKSKLSLTKTQNVFAILAAIATVVTSSVLFFANIIKSPPENIFTVSHPINIELSLNQVAALRSDTNEKKIVCIVETDKENPLEEKANTTKFICK